MPTIPTKGDSAFPVYLTVVFMIFWLALLSFFTYVPPGTPLLVKIMVIGALIVPLYFALVPTTCDIGAWTTFVVLLMPLALWLMVGAPILYALWVAFIDPRIDITYTG